MHRGCSGCTLVHEVFNDLDVADGTALLAEMLEVRLLALEVMNEVATRDVKFVFLLNSNFDC